MLGLLFAREKKRSLGQLAEHYISVQQYTELVTNIENDGIVYVKCKAWSLNISFDEPKRF